MRIINHYGTYVDNQHKKKDNETLYQRSVFKIDNSVSKQNINLEKEPLKQSSSTISFGGSFFKDFKKMVKFLSGFNDEIADYKSGIVSNH